MMVRQVHALHGDRDWLARNLPLVEKFYYYWRVPPHLNQATGLSRYYDLGSGPAPEVVSSERDKQGLTHYERVRNFLRDEQVEDYDSALFYDRESDSLTELAPLQLLAVDGLERYGFQAEARDIARRFTAMVAASFRRDGFLSEKYDADQCTARLHDQITFG